MIYIINAVEKGKDRHDNGTLTIVLQLLNENVNAVEACKAASREYVSTPEGIEKYTLIRSAKENFNWASFIEYVPNSICRRHDIIKLDRNLADIEVDQEESLVEAPVLHIHHIKWDADSGDKGLPSEYDIPLSILLRKGETLDDVTLRALYTRASGYLSAIYGHQIFNYEV